MVINWCEEFVKDFGIALTSLAQGQLPPTLFPPDALEKALTKITTVLPRGYTLTASTKNGELWHFYEEAQSPRLKKKMESDSSSNFLL